MIDRGETLTVKRQCELLGLNRRGVYYTPRPVSKADLQLMRRIDELHLKHPYYGARRLAKQLRREGLEVGRVHVATLMHRMGIQALYRKPRTSIPARLSLIYPYLLAGLRRSTGPIRFGAATSPTSRWRTDFCTWWRFSMWRVARCSPSA